MRKILILGGVGVLSTAAWTATLDARAQGRGSAHGSYGHGGLEVKMRRSGGHVGHLFYAPLLETLPSLFPGEPEPGGAAPGMPIGGVVAGGTEHMIAGHLVGPASHSLAHVAVRVEGEESMIPQPAAPSADDSDQAGAATAQPNPTANPVSARPPGAGGPGRPVSGWSGPGLPGPGRPTSPGW